MRLRPKEGWGREERVGRRKGEEEEGAEAAAAAHGAEDSDLHLDLTRFFSVEV